MELVVIGLVLLIVGLYVRLLAVKKRFADAPLEKDVEVEEKIERLLAEGEDVKAVKVAREQYGFSLIEGKKYIDRKKNAG